MEQSKSISIVIAKLKVAYPYYFKELTNEEFISLTTMYMEELSCYNDLTLSMALKSIIRTRKFMPSISEIIEECECCKTKRGNAILDAMLKDGYFKRGIVELTDEHANRNYEKALSFIERGIIPDWLLKDMKEYGYVEDLRLTNINTPMLEVRND